MIRKTLFTVVTMSMLLALPSFASAKNSLPEFTKLSEQAGKAVVNISTVKTMGQNRLQDYFRFKGPQGGPLDEFLDQFGKLFGPNAKPRKQHALGTGFIVSPDGYIVTNNHVIANADEISVKLQDDEEEYEAKIIGRDPETDLALIKIKVTKSLPVLRFADSDDAEVGEWVVAIGNPFGLGHTVTAGIISARGRVIGAGPFDDFLQTDASINPGNSGGPLINMDGRVVGINTAIVASGSGIGFAIPSNLAKKVIDQLRTRKKVSRGWLGVTIQNLDENTAKALGLPEAEGALVASVVKGDPADLAGVKTSDVITEVNGKPIDDGSDLIRTIAGLSPGEKARLVVWRRGKQVRLTVTLTERNTQALAQRGQQPSDEAAEELGLSMRPVDKQQEAKALGLDKPHGLLVTSVLQGSTAAASDIRPGDVILEVNQQPVMNVSQFRSIVDTDGKKKGVVMLLIKRQGQNIFRTIALDKE